jgi:pimeloyl-ACP methyl ester carboxylesterase
MRTWRGLVMLTLGAGSASCVSQTLEVDERAEAVTHGSALRLACRDSPASVYQAPGGLPPLTNQTKGDIVRCSEGETISANELRAELARSEYTVAVRNGVRFYRFSYRTQRANGAPDVSTALLILPVKSASHAEHTAPALETSAGVYRYEMGGETITSQTYNNEPAPLIVFGHGTAPYRQDCAASKRDPMTVTFLEKPDYEARTVLALAAQGWPVIATDYAGYANGSRVAAYMSAKDEGRAILDATRAAKKLLNDAPEKSVFVGHSQGGHAVLSAQALERDYGMAGELSGVVTHAPFWAPVRTFGFVMSPASGYIVGDPISDYAINAGLEYFYTQSEVLDGAGAGDQILRGFDIDDVIGQPGTECNFFPPLPDGAAGEAGVALLKPRFKKVVDCALTGGPACLDPLAQKWSARFAADRPTLDKEGAPVLLWQSAGDAVVRPDQLAGCAVEKIRQDFTLPGATATLQVCADLALDGDHESVQLHSATHVVEWIKARTQGGPEPTADCQPETTLGLDCLPGNID